MNTKDFLCLDVPLGEATRRAADFVARFILGGGDKSRLHEEVAAIVASPSAFLEDAVRKDFAKALLNAPPLPRAEPVKYHQWGEGLDYEAVMQMEKACLLPVSVSGALMPDAHVGYGLPIGGVLATENAVTVPKILRFFWDWNASAVEADVWNLLGHKSRAVREIAASLLAKLGEARIGKVKELWSAKRADTRIATISWLKAVGTAKAITELKLRLEVEEDDNVRDALLLAIEQLAGPNAKPDLAELEKRIKKTLAQLEQPPVKWLDPKKLPLPKLKDGKKLDANRLLYLLYRQSRVKEMRADIEAKPLYAMLDRATSGDLALAVVQAFFGSKMDAEDRWTMAFAAMVGDDRLVPLLVRQIRTWADASRGKLAEHAVGALALLGTDSALLAVDAMAIRYRAKNKNIGKAAAEAFTEAAQARGLTPEELGDVVVPWLGFEPGQPRLVDAGKAKVEIRITDDFKFAFRDPTTNKRIAKLPDSVPASVKNEFKELSATLKEATKSQLLRMETLMVRQFRWTVKRWRELYLQHPLLIPFAHRLVWGCYDTKGKFTTSFRTLEDRTLTDCRTNP